MRVGNEDLQGVEKKLKIPERQGKEKYSKSGDPPQCARTASIKFAPDQARGTRKYNFLVSAQPRTWIHHPVFVEANQPAKTSTFLASGEARTSACLGSVGKAFYEHKRGTTTSNSARISAKIQYYNSKSATRMDPSMASSLPSPVLSL